MISYSFEWQNFSRVESGNILAGDAFTEGMVLSSDNVLIIKIPAGYEVESVSPGFDSRDGNRLVWDGRTLRSFSRGEPAPTLKPGSGTPVTWFIIMVVMFGLASGTYLILWRRRQSSMQGDKNDSPIPPHAATTENTVWGEEMTEQYLARSGGQAYQSDTIKESGLSKSKISSVLAKMKEDGKILKIRKGKENLIRLAIKK